ncbi:hypothetical protein GX50_08667 [[Emmonsia] crescens]|uniref:Uncharacterized protein n=1 Tax=[Emmonsia] crescens TaxID=73230 RepID=A0A2B7Z5F0_9EURO|nr:hypothetical protein GX50_08667 [Emmonsia crescens]
MPHVKEREGHLPASSRPINENPTEQRHQSNQTQPQPQPPPPPRPRPGPGPRATSIDTTVVELSRELSEMEAHVIGSSSSPPSPLPLLPAVTQSLPMNDRETISGNSSLSNIYLAGRNDDNDVDVDVGVDDDGNGDTSNTSSENGNPRGVSEVVGKEYEWVNCGGAEELHDTTSEREVDDQGDEDEEEEEEEEEEEGGDNDDNDEPLSRLYVLFIRSLVRAFVCEW